MADDDNEFRCWVWIFLYLSGASDADLAERVGVSVPTVVRWKSGEAIPHPALQPAIFEAMRKMVSV